MKKAFNSSPDNTAPCRVLVVDDNMDSAKTMGWMLNSLGYDVGIANNGPDALAKAKDFHPAVVMLDLGMPGMNGFDVCRKMRQDPDLKDTIIVAQTGWGHKEYREQSKKAGFNLHLVKPVDLSVLKKLLTLND